MATCHLFHTLLVCFNCGQESLSIGRTFVSFDMPFSSLHIPKNEEFGVC